MKSNDKPKIILREAPREENAYYHKVSSFYRSLKYIAVITLFAYLIVMLAVNRKSLTQENFMYLLKDLSPSENTSDGSFASISFDTTVKDAALFRGSLITVADNSISLYKSNGKQTYSYSLDYETPILVSGDKYLLAYAIGESSYSLYTNLSKVYSGQTEHEILGGTVSSDGSYALITKSAESKFAVSLYDSDFKLRANYYKDKYVIDCAISADQSRLAIVSVSLNSSRPETELMICKLGESTAEAVITEKDVFPLDICAMKDGRFAVIGANESLFYSPSGELLSRFDYNGAELTRACCSDDGILLLLRSDPLGENVSVRLLSSSGEPVFEKDISAAITSAALSDDAKRIFLSSRDKIYMLTQDGELKELDADGISKLLPYKNGAIAVGTLDVYMCFAEGSASS